MDLSVLFCFIANGQQATLKQIDDVQLKIDELNEQASDEILAVERRYVKLRKPLYEVCIRSACCGSNRCETVTSLYACKI